MSGVLIGVISDTHGLIRPEALAAFRGVGVIFHGGDIGSEEVLEALEKIAPVVAVRGNCDREDWRRAHGGEGIPARRSAEAGGKRFLVIHRINDLKDLPRDTDIVIFGHSHQGKVYEKDGVWYINPGSAGPRRFGLPVTVGRIRIEKGVVIPEVITLL